jgi:hypothetical protein
MSSFRPEHVNAPIFPSSRCLPSPETAASSLARAAWSAASAGRRSSCRTCSSMFEAPTRPLFACCSRAPSRPRTLVRLLQMNVSTSTTGDRSNIPNHRKPWLGRLPSIESCLSNRGYRRLCAGPGVENTESRHSPPRLLAIETSPRPRSHRAPPVADTTLFPVRNDVGRGWCRRHCMRLHGARSVRVVRRRPSAKKIDVHQPEGPSVVGPFAMRNGKSPPGR